MFVFRIGGGGMVVKNLFKSGWSQMILSMAEVSKLAAVGVYSPGLLDRRWRTG